LGNEIRGQNKGGHDRQAPRRFGLEKRKKTGENKRDRYKNRQRRMDKNKPQKKRGVTAGGVWIGMAKKMGEK